MPEGEMRSAVLDGKTLLAALGILEAALADLDFLISTKAKLLRVHPGVAKTFYDDALVGVVMLRKLTGAGGDWEHIAWSDIPPPAAPTDKING